MIRAHVKVLAIACCMAVLPVRAADDSKGFKPLFDGKTLNGWHSFGQKGTGKDWSVVDGSIQLARDLKAPPQDLRTWSPTASTRTST